MRKLLQKTKNARIALLIGAVILLFIVSEGVSLAMDLHTQADSAHNNISQKNFIGQAQVVLQSLQQGSLAIMPNPQITVTPTAPAMSMQCGQGGTHGKPSTGKPGTGTGLRYFAQGTAASTLQALASALPKQVVKVLLEKEIDNTWGVVQSALGFSTKEKAYAFFLGMATRESTLNAGLETGSGSAHSYGPIQAAETAYADANPSYTPEHDVPEMVQYAFTPQNFYDPGIAIYMGIRHLVHFARLAKTEGYSGTQLLRHALMGYNTGYVNTTDQGWMTQYSDEIGAMAGWYLHNRHLYDGVTTWTGDPRVNRIQPWEWY